MSVYSVVAVEASCRVSGCACRNRGPRYPWDVTDEQWRVLEPEVRAVLAELRNGPGGAPVSHDLRVMIYGPWWTRSAT